MSRRPMDRDRSPDGRRSSIGLAVRRIKIAGTLVVGAVIAVVVGNATLLQTGGRPGSSLAESADPSGRRVVARPVATIAPSEIHTAVEVAKKAFPGLTVADVDPMPVGSNAATGTSGTRTARRSLRPRIDAIAAFLNGSRSATQTRSPNQ